MKTLTPRQVDLQLQQISEEFEKKSKVAEDKIARKHIAEQQKIQKLQEEQRAQETEKVTSYIFLKKCFLKVMYIMS